MGTDFGKIYSAGDSFRARAEARQREYRAGVLQVACGKYGHILDGDAANAGENFLLAEAFDAAKDRQKDGKGVAQRTFDNMLSSQAMCFNLFAPLGNRPEFAASVLQSFIPSLHKVREIAIEFTPDSSIFSDQSGRGGVDCDVLIEGTDLKGVGVVVAIETKFVEPEFSICGFRKPGRRGKGRDVCPEDISIRKDRGNCLYVRNKGYRYWERSDGFDVLNSEAVPGEGCPFGGQHWQMWVNHVLAHAEADRRGAGSAIFAVCASRNNTRLLKEGVVLDSFKSLLHDPRTAVLIDLDELLSALHNMAPAGLSGWVDRAKARYGSI